MWAQRKKIFKNNGVLETIFVFERIRSKPFNMRGFY